MQNLIIFVSLLIVCYVNCLPQGPPICTLMPRHSNLQPQPGDWRDHFEVYSFRINQGRLLDPRNRTGTVDPRPNGVFFIIQPKNVPGGRSKEIKGFAVEVNRAHTRGFDPVTFPLINRNRKLKQMECFDGAQFLAHRDASPKRRISFFVANNLDYKTHAQRGIMRFRATVLENYSSFYSLEF
eukprot:TRINITY_DN983_c0_g1_i1.p1 TRINITY_DN983_c0_g1~~TRINITY_DN983_c0_g1_i1.p1  ORF type:complete len:182 (-),score=14.14 TRINITY_DN983_c0_g1_i1:77-622(-)